jgi:NCAIR mutase (PurE)-related protein
MKEEQRARLESVLLAFKEGGVSLESARNAVQSLYFEDLGHTNLDTDRLSRTGYHEVVFCRGKSVEQVRDILQTMVEKQIDILATRMPQDMFSAVAPLVPAATYNSEAKILSMKFSPNESRGKGEIAVVSGGTSDHRIAEEAAATASFFGHSVQRYNDVGVAGLHRLLSRIDDIRKARVIVAVAGMEGTLPGVIAGLVSTPVIAVPTSIGYGANFMGLSALLTMLNSCSAGLSVVNIDNGFGAGYLASMINEL